jgi:hypothetical protein
VVPEHDLATAYVRAVFECFSLWGFVCVHDYRRISGQGVPGLAYSVATGHSTTGGINRETALQESQHVNRDGQLCPEPVNAQSGLETFAPHRTTRRKQSTLRTFICSAPVRAVFGSLSRETRRCRPAVARPRRTLCQRLRNPYRAHCPALPESLAAGVIVERGDRPSPFGKRTGPLNDTAWRGRPGGIAVSATVDPL